MAASEAETQLTVRRVTGPAEYPRLVEIWRSAVDATHDFLAKADRDDIESHLASGYLPQVDLHVAESGGAVVGFAGVSGANLEMLFVESRERGKGIGTALLARVGAECGARTVDVNEQNPHAVAFYRRRGFSVIGRSELDDQGRPYPILHMTLRGADAESEVGGEPGHRLVGASDLAGSVRAAA
ncbi:acetyltransferase [Gulosibacter faecalis]|uniref:Acetyltransferase n=1 Tax=Gulosibacter faecalis TaxID=272240 RepID=A0ABW5UXC0_9MICO|nr:acetyltransferase [Gulosibacter faecalis]